jgi:hypothetical protein
MSNWSDVIKKRESQKNVDEEKEQKCYCSAYDREIDEEK